MFMIGRPWGSHLWVLKWHVSGKVFGREFAFNLIPKRLFMWWIAIRRR
jgi:hypothetical protein